MCKGMLKLLHFFLQETVIVTVTIHYKAHMYNSIMLLTKCSKGIVHCKLFPRLLLF